jgi:long-chain acyl-CoA synthetase
MGSRILLWTELYRGNPLMLSTELENLKEELATARPDYFLNVPALLERIRSGVEEQMRGKNALIRFLHRRGWLDFAIRRKIGANVKFLICGSAALSEETQRWFERIGIPVLQVYGLTETTAIVTMDIPGKVKTGWTGHAVEKCEIRLTSEGELVCRGPNIFAGYWNRPDATAETIRDGWLFTGDLAEIDPTGNLRIIGRTKNLLVPASGHNVAPEPIEQEIVAACPGAEHAVLIGHGRPFLTAIVTGKVHDADIEAAIERVNQALPHYRKVRTFYHPDERLTAESGLLTANQKLRRKAIEEHFREPIERLYRKEACA